MNLPNNRIFRLFAISLSVSFIITLFILHSGSLIYPVYAVGWVWGPDPNDDTQFVVRNKDNPNDIKLRIDANGNLNANMAGGAADSGNLVPNGGFENVFSSSASAMPAGWYSRYFDTYCATCSFGVDSAIFRGGSRSLKMTTPVGGGTASISSDPFPVEPGKNYQTFVDYYCSNTGNVNAFVVYYAGDTSQTNYTQSSGTQSVFMNNVACNNTWQNNNSSVTVPVTNVCTNSSAQSAPCTRARVVLKTSTTNRTAYFDNVKITSSASTTVNAANVSSGSFGSSTGGGNYTFPDNVGIGTLTFTPTDRLTVDSGDIKLSFDVNAPNDYSRSILWGRSQADDWTSGKITVGDANFGYGGFMDFYTNNAAGTTTLSRVMRLNYNGYVGIGTTGPLKKLTVVGDDSSATAFDAGIALKNTSASSQKSTISFLNNSVANAWVIGTDYNADLGDNFFIWGGGSGIPRMYINSDGNVGIGTTGPAALLDVKGSVKMGSVSTGTTDGSLCRSSAGVVYYNAASNQCIPSTRKVKHDINPVENIGLEQVLGLQPVTYIYNSDQTNTTRLGFIAEDVAKVSPLFASYTASGEPNGLSDFGIEAALVKSVQQLQQEILDLKNTVEIQKATIEQLTKKSS